MGKDHYESIAGMYEPLLGGFMHGMRREIVAMARRTGAQSAVDIGCGTAVQAGMLQEAGIQTIGIEPSEAMLNEARKRHSDTLQLYQASGSDMPLKSNSTDLAVLSLILHENSHEVREQIIADACRVLRPDGFLLILEYARPRRISAKLVMPFVHLVERLAGKEHYAGFRDWNSRGALDGIAATWGLAPMEIRQHWFGIISQGLFTLPK